MLLKVFFLVIGGLFLYRLFGGKLPYFDKPEVSNDIEDEVGQIEVTSACAVCGTYVTEDDVLIYQKKSYCSNDCLEKSK